MALQRLQKKASNTVDAFHELEHGLDLSCADELQHRLQHFRRQVSPCIPTPPSTGQDTTTNSLQSQGNLGDGYSGSSTSAVVGWLQLPPGTSDDSTRLLAQSAAVAAAAAIDRAAPQNPVQQLAFLERSESEDTNHPTSGYQEITDEADCAEDQVRQELGRCRSTLARTAEALRTLKVSSAAAIRQREIALARQTAAAKNTAAAIQQSATNRALRSIDMERQHATVQALQTQRAVDQRLTTLMLDLAASQAGQVGLREQVRLVDHTIASSSNLLGLSFNDLLICRL